LIIIKTITNNNNNDNTNNNSNTNSNSNTVIAILTRYLLDSNSYRLILNKLITE